MAFLSDKKLEKLFESEVSDTIKWGELPTNTWYQIENISDKITSQFGDSYILSLVDRNGDIYNVWSIPNLIIKLKFKLGDIFNKFENYVVYCQSLGLKKSSTSDNQYFNFKIVFDEKDQNNEFDLINESEIQKSALKHKKIKKAKWDSV